MLQKATVELSTLELLKNLQSEPLLKSFNLVGDTALALRIGHRKSVDLDLFTNKEFNVDDLKSMLIEKYDLKIAFERPQTLKGFINGVMIDCICYKYPHIFPPDKILIRQNVAILYNEISKFKCHNTNKRFNLFR